MNFVRNAIIGLTATPEEISTLLSQFDAGTQGALHWERVNGPAWGAEIAATALANLRASRAASARQLNL